MKNANYTVINVFVVILIVCSLIFSSVVFLIGNKIDFDFSSLAESDSIAADFFAANSIADTILKNKLSDKTKTDNTSSSSKKQTDKEVNVISGLPLYDFELRENNNNIKNFAMMQYFNFLSGSVEYPLKIPFNCFIVIIMILYGLIFSCLARSIPSLIYCFKNGLCFYISRFYFGYNYEF